MADGLNGLLEVVLPNELVKMPGKVTAQVYVTKQSDETETQAVVAERIFSFTIQESLAWKFDGETKLSYIIEFDELEEHLTERVLAIEKAIANGEDYVTQMKDALQEALTTIEAKVNSVESTVEDLKSSTIKEVTRLKGNATEDITTTANNVKTS
ncbi:MAG: phage baseplate upper protein, partial [Staphylococcus equorum]|nr:phage baseplate upper protein [Staphylococcus equorum]